MSYGGQHVSHNTERLQYKKRLLFLVEYADHVSLIRPALDTDCGNNSYTESPGSLPIAMHKPNFQRPNIGHRLQPAAHLGLLWNHEAGAICSLLLEQTDAFR